MTSAGKLSAIMILHESRAASIEQLGPRPGWWRPFARSKWDMNRTAIGVVCLGVARELAADTGISELALEAVWL